MRIFPDGHKEDEIALYVPNEKPFIQECTCLVKHKTKRYKELWMFDGDQKIYSRKKSRNRLVINPTRWR